MYRAGGREDTPYSESPYPREWKITLEIDFSSANFRDGTYTHIIWRTFLSIPIWPLVMC